MPSPRSTRLWEGGGSELFSIVLGEGAPALPSFRFSEAGGTGESAFLLRSPGDVLLWVWETHSRPLGFLSLLSSNMIFFLTTYFKPHALYLMPVALGVGAGEGRLAPSGECTIPRDASSGFINHQQLFLLLRPQGLLRGTLLGQVTSILMRFPQPPSAPFMEPEAGSREGQALA